MEFRQGVERAQQLAPDFFGELQKNADPDVFSLEIVKESGRVEKVAKLLTSKAKSSST